MNRLEQRNLSGFPRKGEGMKKLTLVGAFLLASCQGGNGSQTSGHFENQTEEERNKILATQPRIIEEHAATAGVMISLKLVSDGSHLEEGQYKEKLQQVSVQSDVTLF